MLRPPMSDPLVTLRRVSGGRSRFIPLLLEADGSEPMLRAYLDQGELYELVSSDAPIGVVLLVPAKQDALEIKNIALGVEQRGRGLGRAAIEAIVDLARTRGAKCLMVGTADSSSGTAAFYRTCGFRDAGRIEGFFDDYPEPVIEDGVRAHDMLRFEMVL